MNDKDLEKYMILYDLANDMAEIVLQDKNSDQYDAVKRFLSEEENQINMNKRLERAEEINHIYAKVASRDKDSEVDQLKNRIKLLEDQRLLRKRKLTNKFILSLTAAVVIIFVILFPLIDGKESVERVAENSKPNVVKKESVKLVLESGEVELLEQNKNISLDGVEMAKTDGSKLTCKAGKIDSVVFATIVVPNESRYTVELEDGTEVFLSANSTLKYPSAFTGKDRRVELTGEAFFKVSKSSKQFIVKASEIEVLVYGTEFNINSYDKSRISTTLLSGSVGVKFNDNSRMREVKITPNQSITIDKGVARIVPNVNTKRYLAWLDGFFRSDEEPLGLLLRDIENWYGVDLEYGDAIRNRLVSASLNSNMPVDSLLRMLEISTNVTITKVDDKYNIK